MLPQRIDGHCDSMMLMKYFNFTKSNHCSESQTIVNLAILTHDGNIAKAHFKIAFYNNNNMK